MKTRKEKIQRIGKSWLHGFVISMFAMLLLTCQSLKADSEVDLWPLFELNKDTTTVCYPLYTNEGDFKMILNFYANTNNGKDHHLFWPFAKISEGNIERVVPFWFSDSPNEFILFPFMVQSRDYTLWTVPPVYMAKDGNYKAVIPFYIKNDKSLFVFPNIFIKDDANGKSVDVFPIYSYSNKKILNSIKKDVRVGNYFYSENFERTSSVFFPFYVKNIPKNPQADSSLLILPYYREWCEETGYSKNICAPFFASETSKRASYTWFLNYYNSKSEDKSTLNIFPFYGQSEEIDHKANTTKESMWVIWPIYSRKREIDNNGSVVAKNDRFLIFSNNRERGGRRTFSILGQVIRERVN